MNRALALCVLSLLACPSQQEPRVAVVDAAVPTPKPVSLTVLVTGAENGYLLPTDVDGVAVGGAANVLARWVTSERHCEGPLAEDGAAPCDGNGTVVASTGDNGNGQAISSYFKGEPTAAVMRVMGYAASALGNRELDWAREQFRSNAQRGGFPYLATNLRAVSDDGQALGLKKYRLLERRGVKVALIGLTSTKAKLTPMPGRMAGVELIPDEDALAQAVAEVRKAGAGVLVVLTDGCLSSVAAMLEKNPAWRIAAVAGRKCEEAAPDAVGVTKLVYPGSRWQQYGRIKVSADAAKAPADQLLSVESAVVDVVTNDSAPPADPELQRLVGDYKTKLDAALGGTIGFTKAGLAQEAPEMSAWLATALKEQFKADVGLVNRKGVRQGLPAGAITKASVYDIIPFENEIIVAKVSGDALLAALGNVEARFVGVKSKGDGFVDAKGAPIDPKKTYTVATTDYLFAGGDGFSLHDADPSPTATKTSWQAATIEWTEAKKSTDKKPLEAMVKVK